MRASPRGSSPAAPSPSAASSSSALPPPSPGPIPASASCSASSPRSPTRSRSSCRSPCWARVSSFQVTWLGVAAATVVCLPFAPALARQTARCRRIDDRLDDLPRGRADRPRLRDVVVRASANQRRPHGVDHVPGAARGHRARLAGAERGAAVARGGGRPPVPRRGRACATAPHRREGVAARRGQPGPTSTITVSPGCTLTVRPSAAIRSRPLGATTKSGTSPDALGALWS